MRLRRKKRPVSDKQRARSRKQYLKRRDTHTLGVLYVRLSVARSRAKRKGLPFDIEASDIALPTVCPILGLLLDYGPTGKGQRDHAPALDRIRNELGYVKGNVQIISNRANRWKSDMTLDDAKKLVAYMELHEMIA